MDKAIIYIHGKVEMLRAILTSLFSDCDVIGLDILHSFRGKQRDFLIFYSICRLRSVEIIAIALERILLSCLISA